MDKQFWCKKHGWTLNHKTENCHQINKGTDGDKSQAKKQKKNQNQQKNDSTEADQ